MSRSTQYSMELLEGDQRSKSNNMFASSSRVAGQVLPSYSFILEAEDAFKQQKENFAQGMAEIRRKYLVPLKDVHLESYNIMVAAEEVVQQQMDKFIQELAEIRRKSLLPLKDIVPITDDNHKQNDQQRSMINSMSEVSSSEITEGHHVERSLDLGDDHDRYDNDQHEIIISEKLVIFTNKQIATGSNGADIFEGIYDGRPVAVKRLLKTHNHVATKEIENLKESDNHRNIVRYYGVESDRFFVYLALERCICNLDDLVQICSADSSPYEDVTNTCDSTQNNSTKALIVYPNDQLECVKNVIGDVTSNLITQGKSRPSPPLLKLMRGMASGLVHLHDLDFIHRDLKPQNVLIVKEGTSLCAKLSDMGISKRLPQNKSSLSHHTTGCGTSGWQAPEQLRRQSHSHAVDSFNLGGLFFFCLTGGKHAFGVDCLKRDAEILENKKNLDPLEHDSPEALDLISRLLDPNPVVRPKAIEALQHPLLWDSKRRLTFVHHTSNRIGGWCPPRILQELEATASTVIGVTRVGKIVQRWDKRNNLMPASWATKIDAPITTYMNSYLDSKGYRPYNYCTVRDLLRFIRNMMEHYQQLPHTIQELVGQLYEDFDEYFTQRFPMLLIEVRKVVRTHWKEEKCFREYFEDINF